MKERMSDRMTTKVLKTRPRVGAASPISALAVQNPCDLGDSVTDTKITADNI